MNIHGYDWKGMEKQKMKEDVKGVCVYEKSHAYFIMYTKHEVHFDRT